MKTMKYLPVIGIILFVYIIWNTGIDKIIAAFLNLNIFYFSIGVVLTFVVLILRGIKFKMVIGLHDLNESSFNAIRIWSIGLFTGMITPGRVGDFIKIFYLDKAQPLGKRLSVVIVDRIVDLVVVLSSAVIGVVLLNVWFGYTVVSLGLISTILAAFFIALYLLTKKNFMRKILRPVFDFFVPQKFKEKIRVDFYEFYNIFGELKNKKGSLFGVTIFNIFIWLLSILEVMFFGFALGIDFNYIFLFAVMSVMVIIELIPISVSGIGTRDAFLLLVLPLIGVTEGVIISFSLFYLVFVYWLAAAVGLVFWIKSPIKLKL
ncbi:MAG: lysylphosphatidylglycerol synthase transmembrane domain-containing protein [Nanoarchaeota archaeon]